MHYWMTQARRIACQACYKALPLYEDGVTTNSTYTVKLSSPTRDISFSTMVEMLLEHEIPYQLDLKMQCVHVECDYWTLVWDMMKRRELKLHDSSTPLFVFQLLDHYRTKRKVVTMEDIRESITPLLFDYLRPYQQTLVKIAVERNDQYIADEMGTGKTYTALAIARYHNVATLIVTLVNIMYNWDDEITNRMDWERKSVIVCKSSAKVLKCDTSQIKVMIVPYGIINNKLVRDKLKKWAKTMIIDECHSVKNLSSARTQAILDLSPHMTHRLILSGSPFEKSKEIYSQMKVLDPKVVAPFFHYEQRGIVSHDDFASRYCAPSRVQFKGSKPQWEFKGNDHQEELKILVSQFMVRRLKKDVCTQLPAKIRHRHDLPEVPHIDIMGILKEMNAGKLIDRSKYVEAIELTCEYKLPSVLEYVKQHVTEDSKYILFFHHMKMKEALMEFCNERKLDYIMIDGSVSAEKRHEMQGYFKRQHHVMWLYCRSRPRVQVPTLQQLPM